MKLSQAKEYLPFVQALTEGKIVQYRTGGAEPWYDVNNEPVPDWFAQNTNFEYRIKPEPNLRPWKPEEVPVGALLREKAMTGNKSIQWLIICRCNDTVYYGKDFTESVTWVMETKEHSLDHGVTWKPCGILCEE